MKPATVDRLQLLQALEGVEGALSNSDVVEQSASFVFRNGRVHTFNSEVYCRTKCPLPEDFTGAVHGKPLIEAVRRLPDDKLTVKFEDEKLSLQGKRDYSYIRVESNFLLPISKVEKPTKFRRCPEDLGEALKSAAECATKDEHDFRHTCVHITPKFVECTDNHSYTRFTMKTGSQVSCLIRATSAKILANRAPSAICDSPKWLHFKNESGLYMSVRRYDDETYWDMAPALKLRGTPTPLPRELIQVMDRLELFSGENADDDYITVDLKADRLRLSGVGVSGGAGHKRKIKYSGNPLSFTVGPATLANIVERHSKVEIVEQERKGKTLVRLVVPAERYFFLTDTGQASNGKPQTATDGG